MPDYDLGTARGKIEIDTTGVNSSIGGANVQLDQYDQRLRRAGQAVTQMGAMAFGMGVAIVGGLALAVKAAADFETEQGKLVGLVGLSREEVDKLKVSVLGLAGQTGVAPVELSKALFMIESAGVRGAAALAILKAAAEGSAVGLGDTMTIANAVVSAVNAYGAANLTAAAAVDVLSATVKLGKVEASSIGPVLGRLLPIASALGISFADVGGALASMTRVGLNADEAATRLSGIMNSLTKITPRAAEALASVGMSGESVRKSLGENGLYPTLMAISNAMGGNIDQMAKIFPNIRALGGVIAITGSNAKENAKIFKEMANATGTLDTAFKNVQQESGFKFQQAMATIKATLISIGDIIAPLAAKLVSTLGAAFAFFNNMPKGLQQVLVIGGGVLGVLLLMVGAAAMFAGAILNIVAAVRLFKDGIAILKAMTAVQWLLNAAAAANPYVIVIAAIIALGVAFYELYTRCKPFRDFIDGIGRWFKAAWDVVLNVLKGVIDWIKGNWDILLAVLTGPLGIAILVWRRFGDDIKGIVDAIVAFFVALPGRVGDFLGKLFSVSSFQSAGKAVREGLVWLFTDAIPTVAITLFNAFVSLFTTVIPNAIVSVSKFVGTLLFDLFNLIFLELPPKLMAGLWKAAQMIWDLFLSGLKAAWIGVVAFFTEIVPAIPGFFVNAIKMLFSIGNDILTGLINGMVAVGQGVLDFFKGLFDRVVAFFKALFGIGSPSTVFLQFGMDIIQGLWNGMVAIWNLLWGWISGAGTAVVGLFVGAVGWLLGAGQAVIQGLWNGAVAIWNALWAWYVGLGTAIIGAFGAAIGWLVNAGRAVLQGLWNGMNAVWTSFAGWILTFGTAIGNLFMGAVGWLRDIGGRIITGLWDGMKAIWNNVTGWLGSLGGIIKNLKGPIEKDAQLLTGAGLAIMGSLSDGLRTGFANEVIPLLKGMSPTIKGTVEMTTSMTPILKPGSAAAGGSPGQTLTQWDVGGVVIPAADLAEMRTVSDFFDRIQVEARRKVGTPG